MRFGETIVSTDLLSYYRLEDLNDATSGGRNLTNHNTVTFIAGKYSNCATFGSSGTNKGLSYTSTSAFADYTYTVGFWFKLNNTSSSNSNAHFYQIRTSSRVNRVRYNISAGTITIEVFSGYATTNLSTTVSFTADTNWHYVICYFDDTTPNNEVIISIDGDRYYSLSTTFSGANSTGSDLIYIGNNSALNAQAWADIDDMCFFGTGSPFTGASRSSRLKLYTHKLGWEAV